MSARTLNGRFPWFHTERWLNRLFDPSVQSAKRENPRIGLVLSSGGARGLAHIGVLQVLEEENVPISCIIGSSMGSYVGALWATGLSSEELIKLAAEIKDRRTLLRLLDPVFPPVAGFVRGDKLRKHLNRNLGGMTIRELKTPTMIVATNLDTVSGEILPPSTPVAAAVHASSAIPAICAPVVLNDKRYIDGGACQPLPVKLLRQHAEIDAVIAINVMPTLADVVSNRLTSFPAPPLVPTRLLSRISRAFFRNINLFAYGNVLDTFKRCLTSAQLRLIEDECNAADVVIHPFFHESRWYDYENFNQYIEAGRKAALDAMPNIRMLLQQDITSPIENHETIPLIPSVGHGSARVLADVAD